MKKFKMGFTLAEVLITLSIIGIVSAIVMPSVITSYQYKTVGVKLSKFMTTTEQAARAYVVQNDSFTYIAPSGSGSSSNPGGGSATQIQDFINDIFIFKTIVGSSGSTSSSSSSITELNVVQSSAKDTRIGVLPSSNYATLKDNTSIAVYPVSKNVLGTNNAHQNSFDNYKIGQPVMMLAFAPNASGLPSTVQKVYNFLVTELGYVLPSPKDECLWEIYNADFSTNAKTFKAGGNCNQSDGRSVSDGDITSSSSSSH